jgi:hypothetical protein
MKTTEISKSLRIVFPVQFGWHLSGLDHTDAKLQRSLAFHAKFAALVSE